VECRDPKIIVGGYPFRVDTDLWKKVGADGQAVDAETAVEMAEKLVMEDFSGF
jgi:methanogenic corrinoid protein MtbC1